MGSPVMLPTSLSHFILSRHDALPSFPPPEKVPADDCFPALSLPLPFAQGSPSPPPLPALRRGWEVTTWMSGPCQGDRGGSAGGWLLPALPPPPGPTMLLLCQG